jgi:hypothetical protein
MAAPEDVPRAFDPRGSGTFGWLIFAAHNRVAALLLFFPGEVAAARARGRLRQR